MATEVQEKFCYRHKKRPTLVSCARCGRPACSDCLVEAPIGYQCVRCAGEKYKPNTSLAKLRRRRRLRKVAKSSLYIVVLAAVVAGAVVVRPWKYLPAGQTVSSSKAKTSPAVASSPDIPLPVAGTDTGLGYSFLDTDAITHGPIRFDPCQTLQYVVNPTGAPAGGLTAVNAAIAQVSLASGIAFAPGGLTNEVPSVNRSSYQPDRYGKVWAPILIGWVPLGKPAGQLEQDGVAAVGGPGEEIEAGSTWVNVSGYVMVNSEASLSQGDLTGILMHELGHVMGLGHVNDPKDIMDPVSDAATRRATWGPGDLAGLQKVGRPAGCIVLPTPGNYPQVKAG